MKNFFLFMITFFSGISLSQVSFEIAPGKFLTLKQGDITQESVDVIVNAANPQLQGGAGVCGAIFKAAGWQKLQNACDKHPIVATPDVRCPFGDARITECFDLHNAHHIIHAAGPDCRIIKNQSEQNSLLEKTYTNSLKLADSYKQKSIAFPFISSAIYAFPADRASSIALHSIIDYFKSNPQSSLQDVRFVLFSKNDYLLFKEKAESLLSKKAH